MPVGLLVVFKYVLIALIWLFFLRALRAVYVQVRPPKVKKAKEEAPRPVVDESAKRSGWITAPKLLDRSASNPQVRFGLRAIGDTEETGDVWPIDNFVTIGRSAGCTISIPDDEFSSSVHCRLTKTDTNYLIEDLGSTNGTFLNGKILNSPAVVSEGDEISAGRSRFKVVRV